MAMGFASRVHVVTSFGLDGWKLYGERFIETFLHYWPVVTGLTVHYDGEAPADFGSRVRWRNTETDEELNEFLLDQRVTGDRSLRRGVAKWARKVFAFTREPFPEVEWMVWIDADVEHTAKVTESWLELVLPQYKDIACLLRPWWRYTECGFVGYNVSMGVARRFLRAIRRAYISGEVFGLEEWHDCFVFDHVRREAARAWPVKPAVHNLAPRKEPADDGLHVWPHSPLADVMVHYKGPRRKKEAYGGAV